MSVGTWISSGLGSAAKLARRIPGWVWPAAAGLLLAAFWLQQHDARIRQQADLTQLQQQTAARVAALKKQAQQDIRQANVENAKAIQELDARRQQMEQQNRQLAAQLDALRTLAEIEAGQEATLPIRDVVTRVAAQLGLNPGDLATEETASSPKGAEAQSKLQITNDELPNGGSHGTAVGSAGSSPDSAQNATPAPRIAPPAQVTPHLAAGTAALSPGRGSGDASLAHIAQNATSAPPMRRAPSGKGAKAQSSTAEAGDHRSPLQQNTAAAKPVAMALSDSGARKVESALVQLNACNAESKIRDQQAANCQARAAAADAAIQRLKGSVASLNQALEAKDKILARQESEYKAEVKAAKGSFLGRLARVTEHVAIGVAVGVVVGVVIR